MTQWSNVGDMPAGHAAHVGLSRGVRWRSAVFSASSEAARPRSSSRAVHSSGSRLSPLSTHTAGFSRSEGRVSGFPPSCHLAHVIAPHKVSYIRILIRLPRLMPSDVAPVAAALLDAQHWQGHHARNGCLTSIPCTTNLIMPTSSDY